MQYRYKLIISYDGTNFFGWQEQPAHHHTIAQELKNSFLKTFGHPIGILGASRTDAGVHALGQVALIRTNLSLDPKTMQNAWNNILKKNIFIRSIEKLNKPFHPWYNVTQKVYYYHIFIKKPLPFIEQYGWYYPYPIDFEKLKEALSFFIGKHDFKSFTTQNDLNINTMRTIDAIECSFIKRFGVFRITIKGKCFMRYMIRRIVGAAVHVAARKLLQISLVKKVLDAKNPHHHLTKAPAHGLMLRAIRYKSK